MNGRNDDLTPADTPTLTLAVWDRPGGISILAYGEHSDLLGRCPMTPDAAIRLANKIIKEALKAKLQADHGG